MPFFVASYLYISGCGSIISVWEDIIFCYRLLYFGAVSSRGAWDRLRYFIVALSLPSI